MPVSVVQQLLAFHGRKLLGLSVMGTAAGIVYAREHHPFEPTIRFLV